MYSLNSSFSLTSNLLVDVEVVLLGSAVEPSQVDAVTSGRVDVFLEIKSKRRVHPRLWLEQRVLKLTLQLQVSGVSSANVDEILKLCKTSAKTGHENSKTSS